MMILSYQSTKRGPLRPPVPNAITTETTLRAGTYVTNSLFGLDCLHLTTFSPYRFLLSKRWGHPTSRTSREKEWCTTVFGWTVPDESIIPNAAVCGANCAAGVGLQQRQKR